MFQLFANSIWQVLALSLVIGAGLPAVFALGIKGMAAGAGGAAEIDGNGRPRPLSRALGVICFAVIIAAIALGISIIVSSGLGYRVSFEHVIPTFVQK